MLIAYMGDQYRMYRGNLDAWTIEEKYSLID